MIHVGIDLHHKNSYVRAIDDHGRLYPGQRIYHTDMEKLWQYLAQFGDVPKRAVFEATANARWMERLLKADKTIEPVAVTPHKVRIIAETVAKTDKIDATVLATLSKMDALPKAWLPDEDVEHLRELIRYRSSLVYMRTRAKNKINGVIVRYGLVRPYGDIFGPFGRQWLGEIELPDAMRLQVDGWLATIDHLNQRILQVERKLYRQVAYLDRWRNDLALLETMPGGGKGTVLTILAELGDYRRFKNRASVSCFAGLVPSSKRSDKSSRYGHITKRGSTELRRILVEVALHATRKVPRYGKLYARLKKERGGNVAKNAVARQMLEDGWTMLMKREPFRYEPVQVQTLMRVG